MSDTPTNQPSGTPTPTTPPPTPPAPDDLLKLQAELNRVGTKELKRGREAAAKEIAEQLGCTVEEAVQKLKAITDAETANLSEAERKLQEATTRTTDAAKATEAANTVIANSLKRDALLRLGMNFKQADAALHLVHVEGEITLESVVEAAKAVKTTFPQLFPADDPNADPSANPQPQPGASRPPDSQPRGQRPAPAGGSTARDRAKARLAERHPELAKQE